MNRKIINVFLALFVVLVFYNTLIPFDFSFQSISNPKIQAGFLQNGVIGSLTDFVGNIILFLPMGFLLYLWFKLRKKNNILLKTMLSGTAISIMIELIQLFLPSRTTSITDVFLNLLGTTVGALITLIYLRFFSQFVTRELKIILNEKPYFLILIAGALLQIISTSVPFVFILKFAFIKQAILNARIIPFETTTVANALFGSNLIVNAHFNWFTFFDNILFWSVWGIILAMCLHLYYYRDPSTKNKIWLATLLFPILLEIPHFLIKSRVFDINAILSAWGGLFIGGLIFRYFFNLQITLKATNSNLKKIIYFYIVFFTL